MLDDMVAASKPAMALQTVGHARACYAWAVKRGKVTANPFQDLPLAASKAERDRVVSDVELADIWFAAAALPHPFGPFYQLAILTMQRREEVAGMRWSELSPSAVRGRSRPSG